jgi:signal transduction histidine kinase
MIKKFRSLTVTLALAFLAISAVVLLITNSLQIYFNFNAQHNIIASQQRLITQEAANTVKSFIQGKLDTLKIAASFSYLTASSEQEKLVLGKLLGCEPAFRQIVLFDSNERELMKDSRLSSLLSVQLTNRKKSDLFSQTKQKKTYISSVYIDEITSEPKVIIAVPVMDILGDIKGTLLAEVNLKFMWDMVGSIKVGEKGLAYVVDKSGNLIASGDISRVLKGENLKHLNEVREFLLGEDKVIAEVSKGINGKYVISSWSALSAPDWAVVIEMPIMEAYRPVVTALKFTLGIMTASFILAVVVGIYLAKRITKPLIDLRNAVTTIGSGDMNASIKVISRDETGQLAVSFNQMIEDLKRTTVSRNALGMEVAERMQVEKELQETVEKLQEANQEMKNFVYIASHDLREPLRKITAFGTMLAKSLTGKLGDDDAENLKFMTDGAARMTKMIEGLLVYSRVSTKTHSAETVDLNDIVKQLGELELSILLEEKHTTLDVPQPLPAVDVDPVQIRQLMQNLIANGMKYQAKDNVPHITITSKPAADGMVRINITDNGIGIAPEFQQAIFIMFKRLHSKNEYEGTGIGLAVCKKIVERHGGQIGVESQPGKGSTFWFTLPSANTKTNDNKLCLKNEESTR